MNFEWMKEEKKRTWTKKKLEHTLKEAKRTTRTKAVKKKQAKFFFNEILHCFFFSPIFDYMVLLSGTVFV